MLPLQTSAFIFAEGDSEKLQIPVIRVFYWDTAFTVPSRGIRKIVYNNEGAAPGPNGPIIYDGVAPSLSEYWGIGSPIGITDNIKKFTMVYHGHFKPPSLGEYVFRAAGFGNGILTIGGTNVISGALSENSYVSGTFSVDSYASSAFYAEAQSNRLDEGGYSFLYGKKAVNLFKNSSYEIDSDIDSIADNWGEVIGSTTATMNSFYIRSGSWCQQVELNNASISGGIFQQVTTASHAGFPGGERWYTVSAYIKSLDLVGKQFKFRVLQYNQAGADLGSLTSEAQYFSAAYKRHSFSTILNSACVNAHFQVISSGVNASFYIDDAQLDFGDVALDYIFTTGSDFGPSAVFHPGVIGAGIVDTTSSPLVQVLIPEVISCDLTFHDNSAREFKMVVPLVGRAGYQGYKYDPVGNYLVHINTSGLSDFDYVIRKNRLINYKRGYRDPSTPTTSASDELYDGFTGHIVDFEIDLKENIATIHCMSFEQRLNEVYCENYPNKTSYWNAGFFQDTLRIEPDGRDKPVAYDAWPLNVALKDIMEKGGMDSSLFYARKSIKDYNKTVVSGNYLWRGQGIQLERKMNYGNPAWSYSDISPVGGEAVDDEYIYPSNLGDTLWGKISSIVEKLGYYVGFNGAGDAVLMPRNNPDTIIMSSAMGVSGNWTTVHQIEALGGEYKESDLNNFGTTNILANADFENGLTSWVEFEEGGGDGSADVAYGGMAPGLWEAELRLGTSDVVGIRQTRSAIGLTGGDTWELSAWMRTSGDSFYQYIRKEEVIVTGTFVGFPYFRTTYVVALDLFPAFDIQLYESDKVTPISGGAGGIEYASVSYDGQLRLYPGINRVINSGDSFYVDYVVNSAGTTAELVIREYNGATFVALTSSTFLVGNVPGEPWINYKGHHDIVSGTSTVLIADVVLQNHTSGFTYLSVDNVGLRNLDASIIENSAIDNKLQFDFSGSRLQIITGLEPIGGYADVAIYNDENSLIVRGQIDTYNADTIFYYSRQSLIPLVSSTVIDVMGRGDNSGYGNYYCVITPTSGSIIINGALAYDIDSTYPLYGVRTSDNIMRLALQSNMADQRNDALVVGQRITQFVAGSEDENKQRNPNNPTFDFVYSRFTDSNSIFAPDANNYTGYRKTAYMFSDDIASQEHADWMAWAFLKRYSDIGESVDVTTIGMPHAELFDPIFVQEAGHNYVNMADTVWINEYNETMSRSGFESNMKLLPYPEYPSFEPKAEPDISDYGYLPAIHLTAEYDGTYYDPYDSEAGEYVKVVFDTTVNAFYRVSIVDAELPSRTVAYLTNPTSDTHWVQLDSNSNQVYFWDGVDQIGLYNSYESQYSQIDNTNIGGGFYVANSERFSDGGELYSKFTIKIEAQLTNDIRYNTVVSNSLNTDFNDTSSVFVKTKLGPPTCGYLACTGPESITSGLSSYVYTYEGLIENSTGILLTFTPYTSTSGRLIRTTFVIAVMPHFKYLTWDQSNRWEPGLADVGWDSSIPYYIYNTQETLFEKEILTREAFDEGIKELQFYPQNFTYDFAGTGFDEQIEFGNLDQAQMDISIDDSLHKPLCIWASYVFFFSGNVQDRSGRKTWMSRSDYSEYNIYGSSSDWFADGPNSDLLTSTTGQFPVKAIYSRQWWNQPFISRMEVEHNYLTVSASNLRYIVVPASGFGDLSWSGDLEYGIYNKDEERRRIITLRNFRSFYDTLDEYRQTQPHWTYPPLDYPDASSGRLPDDFEFSMHTKGYGDENAQFGSIPYVRASYIFRDPYALDNGYCYLNFTYKASLFSDFRRGSDSTFRPSTQYIIGTNKNNLNFHPYLVGTSSTNPVWTEVIFTEYFFHEALYDPTIQHEEFDYYAFSGFTLNDKFRENHYDLFYFLANDGET